MSTLVEMRTASGRTFGIAVTYKNHRYLYVEKEDAFYDDTEGLPRVKDSELIQRLNEIKDNKDSKDSKDGKDSEDIEEYIRNHREIYIRDTIYGHEKYDYDDDVLQIYDNENND